MAHDTMDSIIFRVKGTVIFKIWWKIFLVTVYATGVMCVTKLGWDPPDVDKFHSETTVGIFGLFTGFLLVFRANRAYDIYWEGRQLWSAVSLNVRILTRVIWTMISTDSDGEQNKLLIEKVSVINLLIAFAYATRNYLRGNYSYYEKDLFKVNKHTPKFEGLDCSSDDGVPRNIPIEISHLIASYITKCFQAGLVDEPSLKVMNNSLNNLVECVAEMDKVKRTPIPAAYSVHLNHLIWLYFLALPLQLFQILGWFTIPVVATAAFAVFGVLSIGLEIENPFANYDSDLPMDEFCESIHSEVLMVLSYSVPPAQIWIFSSFNFPLIPISFLPANLLVKLDPNDIRGMLVELHNYDLPKAEYHYLQ